MPGYLKKRTLSIGLIAGAAIFTNAGHASTVGGCIHNTDGAFDTQEWTCPTVSKSFFPQVGSAGGAFLYVDQGQGNNNNLYLMYDYVGGVATSSFFDVFFEVVPDGHAYLVRIPGGGGLLAFERPIGSVAPLLPNGSFDIGINSGWDPLSAADLALAQFKGAVGFGISPDDATPHPMAEFQLTVDHSGGPGGGPGGIYSPDPAFWSASEKSSGGADPPISSGIFILNPNGTTTVNPVLGPNGDPVMQGTVTLPEPGTFLAFASGLLGLLGCRRLRGSKQL
jgi:hypothetical protein